MLFVFFCNIRGYLMVNSWSISGLSGLLVVISWSLWLLVVTRGHVRAVFTIRKRTIRTVGAEPNYGHGGFFVDFSRFYRGGGRKRQGLSRNIAVLIVSFTRKVGGKQAWSSWCRQQG